MDTEVYLICPCCKTITQGEGSGDMTDQITCKTCSKLFVSVPYFKYKKFDLDIQGHLEYQEKKLYIPVDFEIDYPPKQK